MMIYSCTQKYGCIISALLSGPLYLFAPKNQNFRILNGTEFLKRPPKIQLLLWFYHFSVPPGLDHFRDPDCHLPVRSRLLQSGQNYEVCSEHFLTDISPTGTGCITDPEDQCEGEEDQCRVAGPGHHSFSGQVRLCQSPPDDRKPGISSFLSHNIFISATDCSEGISSFRRK